MTRSLKIVAKSHAASRAYADEIKARDRGEAATSSTALIRRSVHAASTADLIAELKSRGAIAEVESVRSIPTWMAIDPAHNGALDDVGLHDLGKEIRRRNDLIRVADAPDSEHEGRTVRTVTMIVLIETE